MSSIRFQQCFRATLVGAYLAASGAAFADDTEVFFTQEYRDTSKPNILFILDTSGSMGSRPASSGSSGPVKMDIVKSAMKNLLDSMTNVNVGLARFTVPGGPILMPVKDIDLPSDPLVSASITDGADDAEESTAGVTRIDSPDLDIVEESDHAQWVAIRFNKVDVPQGATISKAVVSMSAWSSNSGTVALRLFGDDTDNAAAFTTANNNISGRPLTLAEVPWSITSSWTTGQRYSSVDIAPIIQEVTSRSGWCGGNSLVIMMRRDGAGTTKRVVHAYESASPTNTTFHPKLNIQFSGTLPSGANGCYTAQVVATVEGATDDVEESGSSPYTMTTSSTTARFKSSGSYKAIGLRFPKLRVPQGATIVDSYVKFRNNQTSGGPSNDGNFTGTTTVNVQAVNTDNFGGWTPTSGLVVPTGLTGSTLTKTSAVSVTLPDWLKNTTVGHSGNLNSVVAAVTGRGGWSSGNAMGLVMIYASGTEKRASSYEGKVPAQLTVRYRGTFETGTYTVRDDLKVATDQLVASGWTPLSDTMLEGGLYYRGEAVEYGKTRMNSASNRISNPTTWTGGTVTGSAAYAGCDPLLDPLATACASEVISGAPIYKSPITDTCEDNFIVFLTDGEPTWHDNRTTTHYARISALSGSPDTCSVGDSARSGSSNTGTEGGECLVKLAGNYFQKDQSTALQGKQNIKSYFIGFDINLPLLNDAAAAGGTEQSQVASDAAELASSFNDILDDINIRTNTFVTAGVTVNQANRLTHLDQLYFSIFAPDVAPRWAGNLKRYQLGDHATLLDVNGSVAVETNSDQFVESAQSWWSTAADGNNPKEGGAASKLVASRPLYTNASGSTNVVLKVSGNLVHEGNSAVTDIMLSVAASERTKVLQWARGLDVLDEDGDGNFGESNYVFGDPLHSRPALVNYDDGTADGLLRVFVGTNRGELHSVDTETGVEQWAYVPADLLPHYNILMNNADAAAKPYGLDGSAVPYLKDINGDGKIKASDGDKAYLYVGMRRGGSNYYVLDVSDRTNPILKFIINGGVGDYAKLSQTWSHPVISKAKIGSAGPKPVMIFGGGYSIAQDADGAPLDDSVGNVVYIADAETGARMWSSDEISGLGMNKSVPADVAAIDLNSDGLIDHLYAADMGANIWRFDIMGDGSITGGAVARFQPVGAGESNNRRFYGGVDVGLIQRDNGSSYVVVAAGSGFRERPLNKTIDEQFYVFRDDGVFGNTIIELDIGDLINITNLIGDTITTDEFASDAIKAIEEAGAAGWYYVFGGEGEKSLTAPVIFNNSVLFTTYVPPTEGELDNDCGGAAGTGRFYAMSILDGNPIREHVLDSNGDPTNELCVSDDCRYTEIEDCPTCGFVPPQVLYTDDGDETTCDIAALVGTKAVDPGCPLERVSRVKWRHP